MLSDAQFAGLHQRLREEGGFTVNVHTGKEPSSGWMISDPGAEEVRPQETTSPGTLRGYAVRHSKALSPATAYFGAWNEDGQDSLDVSRNYPVDTPLHRVQAMGTLFMHEQKAAYDYDTDSFPRNPAGDPTWMKGVGLRSLDFVTGAGVTAVVGSSYRPRQ